MRILRSNPPSLWDRARQACSIEHRFIRDDASTFRTGELLTGSVFGEERELLRGANVLIVGCGQLGAAIALLELDGFARRLVICPPDLPPDYLSDIARSAEITDIVGEIPDSARSDGAVRIHPLPRAAVRRCSADREPEFESEWVMFTSGTTGRPKMVVHSLETLAGHMRKLLPSGTVWSTFYDIRRYGGLQILLRALSGGASLVLSSSAETVPNFLARAESSGVTHISGTPSHWRRALMSGAAQNIRPKYVRLSGEPSDQAILDRLKETYPEAQVVHAFASTEAGLAFEVADGQAGFPARLVGSGDGGVEMRIEDDTLRIRSARTAGRYLGAAGARIMDQDGFIDTGDTVETRGERYFFTGRRDGVINIGGLKVHPEEVEALINLHPAVQMSLVRGRASPVVGSIVVADIVLRGGTGDQLDAAPQDAERIRQEIWTACREKLPPHKVPAVIRVVPGLEVMASGKLARTHA